MLTEVINSIIQEPDSAPEWMTEGKTSLVFKKGEENEAKNYRPITCLPTIYKLLTLIITESIYTQITDMDILPYEQKGCTRKARGCKEHLILDRNILETAKKNKRNVSILWIDYKIAYDSVPHSWIEEILTLYKFDPIIRNFIKQNMKTWRMRISLPTKECKITLDEIFIERGIFQGDSLSPLLFCIALAPLSRILQRAKVGFKLIQKTISHLLYMDDLKVYAKNREEIVRCIELIKKFSDDICMDFGLEKCAVLHVEKALLITHLLYRKYPILDQKTPTNISVFPSHLKFSTMRLRRKRKVCTLAEFEPF